MPKASVKRVIKNKKDKLIEFVLDIEKYPEFIPFCENSKIYERNDYGETINIIADLTIGKGPFKETYKSNVLYKKKDNLILVTNLDGPLNHLTNKWLFISKDNFTEVTFDIDFEIENKFLNVLMEKSFQFGLDKIADAFQKRAEELFNKT